MTAEQTRGPWFTSSRSGGNNNSCVEARFTDHGIDVRDSKDRWAGHLSFTSAEWFRFLERFAK